MSKILFLLLTFSIYSWCLYHLAYAYGGHVEQTGNQRQLRSCQAVITHNLGAIYE